MGVRVEIDNRVPKEVKDHIEQNEESIARAVELKARTSTAFKDVTGTLRKRIKAKKSRYEFGGWIVEARAPHAHLVEFGHGGPNPAPAHPFLRPALESEITEAKAKFGVR